MTMFQVCVGLFVIAALVGVNYAQLPTGGQQPQVTPCMEQFNTNLAQRCFNSRGVSWEGTINMISQGQQGAFPNNTTPEVLRALLCREDTLDYIIPCALQLSSYYFNQTTCGEQQRMTIAGTARQLTGFLQQFCFEPCEVETNQRAMQCFATAQIDPLRSMNTTMLADKFHILGNTSQEVQRFCANHGTLFTCLENEKARCPAFVKRMFEEGVDFTAMKQATAVLCQKQQEYMLAMQCFTQNQAALQSCMMETGRSVQELVIGRIALGTVPPSQMVGRLCELRVKLVPCELKVFQQTCQANLNQLRREFECNILATPCRNDPNLAPVIAQMCLSSPPPQQSITQRPPVVPPPNINTFPNTNINTNQNPVPNNNNNMNPNMNNNNNNNNNNFNTGHSMSTGDNGGVSISGSMLVTAILLLSVILLH